MSYIIDDYLEYQELEKDIEDLKDDVIEKKSNDNTFINWENLKNTNKDIIGWIKIEDTNINYPILKDTEDLYYLQHSYNKKYNSNRFNFYNR